jgi:PAS domain S-box-containing protein
VKQISNFIFLAPAVLLLNAGNVGNIPNWIWWTLFFVGGAGLFYFIVHLELGRRLKILTHELREKNLELQNHKDHLEELIAKRTKKLSESEKKYRLIAENASDIIWTIDPDGNYMYISPSVERIRGFKPEQIIGQPIEKTLSPESATFVRKLMKELQESESPMDFVLANQRFEIQHPRKDGKSLWSEVMTSPLYNEAGELIGFQGVTRDITDRKNTELELRETNEKLVEANNELKMAQTQLIQSEKMASLGELTAGIAHEINNPVNYVYTSILPLSRDIEELKTLVDKCLLLTQSDDLSKRVIDVQEYAKQLDIQYIFEEIFSLVKGIREGSDRTKEIVEGLRNFSRLDADTLRPANIHEGIDSTLMLLRNKITDQINIEKKYGKIPPINCYPGKLNQVFMNILNNAISAIGLEGEIQIKTYCDNDNVYISIRDNGPGMTEEVKNRIFEPFFTTKEVGQGTGLGLSIGYGIMKNHKGKITVKSKPGDGTEFIIQLPSNLAEQIK